MLPGKLLPHDRAVFISMSADGAWVATGTHSGTGIRVSNAKTQELEIELPIDFDGTSAFSPDGRWLATVTSSECRLWSVGSWQPGPRFAAIGRHAAFSPDSGLLAVETDRGIVTLFRPDTGQSIAILESPNQDGLQWLGFSPDGGQLVMATTDNDSIRVWDLRRIREQLVPLGLDWRYPALPPLPDKALTPIRELRVIEK